MPYIHQLLLLMNQAGSLSLGKWGSMWVWASTVGRLTVPHGDVIDMPRDSGTRSSPRCSDTMSDKSYLRMDKLIWAQFGVQECEVAGHAASSQEAER